MEPNQKTVIVTGASQGIGAGVVQAFLSRGYNIVGTSRSATKSKKLSASDHLALIDGDIGQFETAQTSRERIGAGVTCTRRRSDWNKTMQLAKMSRR
jgi:NAD(P)-dependent dehydrogenase (short-subunit alcohol dehydrogenase family)